MTVADIEDAAPLLADVSSADLAEELIRRGYGVVRLTRTRTLRGLVLDGQRLRWRGGEWDLSRREAAVVHVLMRVWPAELSRAQLTEAVWGRRYDVGNAAVVVAVLRRKVPGLVAAGRMRGYRLELDAKENAA